MSEPHVLLSLPTVVLDEIMKNLSPLDYLNLARVDKYLYKFVYYYPKKYRILSWGQIYNWNNDPTQPVFGREYRFCDSQKIREEALDRMIIMKEDNEIEERIFVDWTRDEIRKRKDADQRILYNNATVDTLESDPKLLDLNIKTTFISPDGDNSDGDNLDNILEQISRFGATELHYPKRREYSQSVEEWRKFFSHPIICNLQYIQLMVPQAFLPLLQKYSAARMDIFNENLENMNVLVDTLTEMIREWMDGRRNIKVLKFCFSFIGRSGVEKLDEFDRISSRLAEHHPGGFAENDRVDKDTKLIKREDGKGLFIRSRDSTLCILECDYKFRRENIMNEEIAVERMADPEVLQREFNINQLFTRRNFFYELMMDQNRTWPDKRDTSRD